MTAFEQAQQYREQVNAKALAELKRVHDESRSKGFAEGIEKGLEKGIQEGTRAGEKAALLLVVGARGIALSASETARMEACEDISVLQRWLQNAAFAETASAVFAM